MNSEEHFNVIAAYQPSTREHNHSASESEELRLLRKKIRLLKLAQCCPQQPQQFQNRMNYSGHDAFQFQERMRNEIRRMQARIDSFMKAYANRNNRQEQPRVRTREGRPVCDICGRAGHLRQNCYARIYQRNQYHNHQNTSSATHTVRPKNCCFRSQRYRRTSCCPV